MMKTMSNRLRGSFRSFFIPIAAVALACVAAPTAFASAAGECILTGLSPAQIEAKANAILAKLTLKEKIHLLAGNGSMCTRQVKKLGIPRLNMSDASIGVRVYGPSTAYPASVCLAATWNPKLAMREGQSLGSDARARGVNIILGPGINIMREPQSGRNFEFLGEDPFLTSRIAVPWIIGLQSTGVAACAKHYCAYEQETHRMTINAAVTRRALQEIYLPPFRAAVRDAHVWTIMAAYNRVNDYYCTASRYLLTDVLRNEWGFKGVLMSDWGATHATRGPMAAGLDLEMPNNQYYNYKTIDSFIKKKDITVHEINRHVRRLLRMMIATGFMHKRTEKQSIPLNNPHSAATAFKVAAEGTVLLKNSNGILPLHRSKLHTIAVIGPMATPAVWCGGGSAYAPSIINPISMLAAIRRAAGPDVRVVRVPFNAKMARFWGRGRFRTPTGKPGLLGEYYDNSRLAGKPVMTRIDKRIGFNWGQFYPVETQNEHFSVRWTGTITPKATATYLFEASATDPCRVILNHHCIIRIGRWNNAMTQKVVGIPMKADKTYRLKVEYFGRHWNAEMEFGWVREGNELLTAAEKRIVRKADVVIACMGYGPNVEHEGIDHTFHLWGPQDQYLREVAGINPHTIVVLNAGAPVATAPWIHRIAGFIDAWYPGENGNRAVADIIFGKICPSGRLPDTFARHWRDEPAYGHFPGHAGQVDFNEGIYVGYRWFDHYHIKPLYPFGYGLSYTTFSFGKPQFNTFGQGEHFIVHVAIPVTDTGKRSGAEVVQLYIRPLVDRRHRCFQTLKAFDRFSLKAGQTGTAHLNLKWRDFAYFSSAHNKWIVPPGRYELAIGDSSRDILATAVVKISH